MVDSLSGIEAVVRGGAHAGGVHAGGVHADGNYYLIHSLAERDEHWVSVQGVVGCNGFCRLRQRFSLHQLEHLEKEKKLEKNKNFK